MMRSQFRIPAETLVSTLARIPTGTSASTNIDSVLGLPLTMARGVRLHIRRRFDTTGTCR